MFEDPDKLETDIGELCTTARMAALQIGTASDQQRQQVLATLADLIENRSSEIAEANEKDLAATGHEMPAAMRDRLKLTPERIQAMAMGVRQVAALPDPVGEEIERLCPPSGLDIRKVRVPIGVVAIIYESRPNVTIDCAALCLRSGNACILRGGREAFHSNRLLSSLVQEALQSTGLPGSCAQFVGTTDRTGLLYLLKRSQDVHCVIPRGGEGLIRFVTENSTIPVIKHYTGVCSIYVHPAADLTLAGEIVHNAKCQRPGVCNAIENLLLHRGIAKEFLRLHGPRLIEAGVIFRADECSAGILAEMGLPAEAATEADWSEEYLDLRLAVKVIDDDQEAIAFINHYGSHHSDAIVTTDETAARVFLAAVDSAAVYWNASTRFTDGFEFGMGAEIGISTDRLHARGPMGLKELCTYKYVILGRGQIRT